MSDNGLVAAKPLAEHVAGVPSGPQGRLRDFVTHGENYPRAFASGVEVERLVHVVLRGVVARGFPLNGNFSSVERGIHGLKSFTDSERRDPLLHERILVAANEEILLGHGIRADFEAYAAGDIADLMIEAAVVRSQRNDVLEIVEQ